MSGDPSSRPPTGSPPGSSPGSPPGSPSGPGSSPPSDALTAVLLEAQRLGYLGARTDIADHVAHARRFAEAFAGAVGADVDGTQGDAGPVSSTDGTTDGTADGTTDGTTNGTTNGAVPPRLLDLGSGGGIPGLVLAELWPSCAVWLVDAAQKRVTFLTTAIERLKFGGRVHAVHGRAEDLARRPDLRGCFDLVVARSFASPAITAECATGFLHEGGRLIVSEPPSERPGDRPTGSPREPGNGSATDSRWRHPAALHALGELGLVVLGGPPGFQVLEQRQACPDRYPRRAGIPAKRPLF